MNNPTRIVLFDVDGVLIIPGGYRQALTDTLRDILSEMNLSDLTPAESVYEHFESHAITSEWDMIPLYLCIVLNAAAQAISPVKPWQTLMDAITEIKQTPLNLKLNISYAQEQIGLITNGKPEVPSELVFQAQDLPNFPYPSLKGFSVLAHLLTTTRSISDSPTTARFQEHILGSQLFEERYHQKATTTYDSYLTTYDQLALSEQSRALIADLLERNKLQMSIYTARPSLPPEGISADHNAAYSPEAEQALRMVNLSPIHLCAYGKLAWIAQEHHLTADQCLKPSPLHALSAIAVHFMNEIKALHWAAEVYHAHLGNLTLPLPESQLPGTIELHVFEDSPGGLRGGFLAAELLSQLEIEIDLHLWGISKNPQKKTALRAQGGVIYEDVNDAITAAFG